MLIRLLTIINLFVLHLSKKLNMKTKEKKQSTRKMQTVKLPVTTIENIDKVAKKLNRTAHYLRVNAITEKYGK